MADIPAHAVRAAHKRCDGLGRPAHPDCRAHRRLARGQVGQAQAAGGRIRLPVAACAWVRLAGPAGQCQRMACVRLRVPDGHRMGDSGPCANGAYSGDCAAPQSGKRIRPEFAGIQHNAPRDSGCRRCADRLRWRGCGTAVARRSRSPSRGAVVGPRRVRTGIAIQAEPESGSFGDTGGRALHPRDSGRLRTVAPRLPADCAHLAVPARS